VEKSELKKIPTRDEDGNPNGFVVPIWNVLENDYRPAQVYLTAVAPGSVKGPHLHKVRTGRFVCVSGNVRIVTRVGDNYREYWTGEDCGYALVTVPTGVPAAIYNRSSDKTALVLNMPTPAWSPDNQDEWPVHDWCP
jgi:dTDP-4-dehydrorhamnose 3,5-epimerase-like enzyme